MGHPLSGCHLVPMEMLSVTQFQRPSHILVPRYRLELLLNPSSEVDPYRSGFISL